MDKKDIIWKDRKILEIIRFVLILIPFFGSLFGVFLSLTLSDKSILIISLIIFIISIYGVYISHKRKTSFIVYSGIIIGNLTFSKQSSYDLNQNPELIKWDSIKSILIKGKVHSSRVSILMDYLYVLRKNGKTYECLIYDPKGFVEALKKLNKYHLLSKDSKYR